MTLRKQWRKLHTGLSKSNKIRQIDVKHRMAADLLYRSIIPWCDDEGRVQGDNDFLRTMVVPNYKQVYSDATLNKLISILQEAPLLVRYKINGDEIIQILEWDVYNSVSPTKKVVSSYKPFTGAVLQKNCSGTAVTDIEGEVDKEVEVDIDVERLRASCPFQEIVDLYNKILPDLPRVKILSDKRKTNLKERWNSSKERQTIEYWKGFFEYVSECDFLMGRVNDWHADFEWLTTEGNFIKVIEGNYRNKQGKTIDRALGLIKWLKTKEQSMG